MKVKLAVIDQNLVQCTYGASYFSFTFLCRSCYVYLGPKQSKASQIYDVRINLSDEILNHKLPSISLPETPKYIFSYGQLSFYFY